MYSIFLSVLIMKATRRSRALSAGLLPGRRLSPRWLSRKPFLFHRCSQWLNPLLPPLPLMAQLLCDEKPHYACKPRHAVNNKPTQRAFGRGTVISSYVSIIPFRCTPDLSAGCVCCVLRVSCVRSGQQLRHNAHIICGGALSTRNTIHTPGIQSSTGDRVWSTHLPRQTVRASSSASAEDQQ